MKPDCLDSSQLELLFHAGIGGLCRAPARSVADVDALREAGLAELGDSWLRLTPAGQRHAAPPRPARRRTPATTAASHADNAARCGTALAGARRLAIPAGVTERSKSC